MPARGLKGERAACSGTKSTRFPFFNVRLPEVSPRGLLMYRYRRMGEARAAAHEAGVPWCDVPVAERERGNRGDPAGPPQPGLGPQGASDLSRNQRPGNAAIFYNIWQYFRRPRMTRRSCATTGAEMMLEIVRFWASITHFNPERERYEIHGVMGPDEFHDKYPDALQGGLRNNAYTNVMVAWLCGITSQLLPLLPRQPSEGALRDAARHRRRRASRCGRT